MWITVFGASHPDEKGYQEAQELGELIAKAGHFLKNGGYGGTMEASAKGCNEYGGISHGVCVDNHPFPGEHRPNTFLTHVVYAKNIEDRIEHLLLTDAIITLPGTIGTLHELMVGWVQEYCKEEQSIPIYLVGDKYKELMSYMFMNGFVKQKQLECLNFVETIYDIGFLKNQ
jgi:uncharacterized protein (TIGR00730 family)